MRPRIAILMDENTSTGATRYEAHKGYFNGVLAAGGAPFGVPYALDMVSSVVEDFDGLISAGGRFAYPPEWYLDGEVSHSPASERFEVEWRLMSGFLSANRPVLGICAGMQMMACLRGSKLASDVSTWRPSAVAHDSRESTHSIFINDHTLLRSILGTTTLQVNSFHREALAEVGADVCIAAHAEDGIIEAIELSNYKFAIGIQWHQELLASAPHDGNKIFTAFVEASRLRTL